MVAKHEIKIVAQVEDRRNRKDTVADVQEILDAGLEALRHRMPGVIHLRVSTGGHKGIVGRSFSNCTTGSKADA